MIGPPSAPRFTLGVVNYLVTLGILGFVSLEFHTSKMVNYLVSAHQRHANAPLVPHFKGGELPWRMNCNASLRLRSSLTLKVVTYLVSIVMLGVRRVSHLRW